MLALEFSGLNSGFLGLRCVVVGYGPNEGEGEERFWNDMGRALDSVGN